MHFSDRCLVLQQLKECANFEQSRSLFSSTGSRFFHPPLVPQKTLFLNPTLRPGGTTQFPVTRVGARHGEGEVRGGAFFSADSLLLFLPPLLLDKKLLIGLMAQLPSYLIGFNRMRVPQQTPISPQQAKDRQEFV